jgi:hypothetical protein
MEGMAMLSGVKGSPAKDRNPMQSERMPLENDSLENTSSVMPSDTTALDDFGLLTLQAVAELLHCSKAHISNVIAGRVSGCPPIPAVHLGRRKLVRRESLITWIERNELGGGLVMIRSSPERGRKNA